MNEIVFIFSLLILGLISISVLAGIVITESRLFKMFGFVVIFIISIILVVLGAKI